MSRTVLAICINSARHKRRISVLPAIRAAGALLDCCSDGRQEAVRDHRIEDLSAMIEALHSSKDDALAWAAHQAKRRIRSLTAKAVRA